MRKSRYNKQKRLRRVAEAVLKQSHVAAVFVVGNNGFSHMVNHKNQQLITVDQTLSDIMTKLPFKWSTLIAVTCKDTFGKEYMKAEQIDIDMPLKQSELADYLNEQHQALIENCNSNHIVNVAWISSPFPMDWDENVASKIFEKLNGWKAVAIELREQEIAA